MLHLFPESSGAHFSPCNKYRYSLHRIWDVTKPLVMFIGLNPSTANQVDNDPTIRRVMRFAADWGYGGVYMMNLFPLVSTDPSALNAFYDSEIHNWDQTVNNGALERISQKCQKVIFAWGSFKIAKERAEEMCKMFPTAEALFVNKDGSPRHPLYVAANTKPELFKVK